MYYYQRKIKFCAHSIDDWCDRMVVPDVWMCNHARIPLFGPWPAHSDCTQGKVSGLIFLLPAHCQLFAAFICTKAIDLPFSYKRFWWQMLFWQILLTINKIGNTHCNASHSSDSKTFWNFGWLFAFVTACFSCFSRKMHHFSSWSDAGTPSPLSPVLLPCDLGCDFGNGSGSVQASVFVFFVSGDLLQKGPKGFAPTQTAAKIWVKCKSLFCFSANHSSSHFVSKQRNKTQGKTSSSPEVVWESRSPSNFFFAWCCVGWWV